MRFPANDTIAAISTPIGEGAIAVIRLSGPASISIADRLFSGKGPLSQAPPQTIHFGQLTDAGGVIDNVLVSVFRSPHSYTGEDLIEISSHGSTYLAKKILSMLVDAGARHAEPGEFTRRAFLNGKMDLAQAEAVADLIKAHSETSHAQALAQQRGILSGVVRSIREEIKDVCALLELDLDFTEEELQVAAPGRVLDRIDDVLRSLSQLIDSYEFGKSIRDGVRVVLAGPPNVGKSSILNALLREHRAIVTDFSGTTRDTIEESMRINGMACNISDTAGIRDTVDVAEREGIDRARQEILHADLVLLVGDDQTIANPENLSWFERFAREQVGEKDVVIVFNKIDLMTGEVASTLQSRFGGRSILRVSARTGEGMPDLEREIYTHSVGSASSVSERSVTVSNLRQKEKLDEARRFLMMAREGVLSGATSELWAADLRSSLLALSEIVGENVSEEVLNHIFSRFCIGK